MKISEIEKVFQVNMPDMTSEQQNKAAALCNMLIMKELSDRLTKLHAKIAKEHIEMITGEKIEEEEVIDNELD